ncbi:hypothetical protein [uncultured Pantoea sp.]|uniref:hypothetical protein n=1 Tax=uncultured Pantoea sp. TaxID=218084 RepID=UPI002054ED3A|nr:hypothetical protein [uncultured Pantoea sp.]DAL08702.1 MAG TPA_asm: hypothetical protein [Caudoviricetes sp.]
MEKSHLPQWFVDASTIVGVVGFLITIIGFFLTYIIFNQTRELKFRFVSKARLPKLSEDLNASSSTILKFLKQDEIDFNLLSSEVSRCAGLVENVILKLNNSNNKSAKSLLGKIRYKRWLIGPYNYIKIADKEKAWEIYYELAGFTTNLNQIIKDSHWD